MQREKFRLEWNYKLPLAVSSGKQPRSNFPVEVTLDFGEFLEGSTLDHNSIRLFEVDLEDDGLKEIPSQFEVCSHKPHGTLTFIVRGRMETREERRYLVYFDTLENGVKPRPQYTTAVSIKGRHAGTMILRINEVDFLGYNFNHSMYKPYFYPLIGPSGRSLVCNSPSDHSFHHALWFAWGSVNNVDFWGEELSREEGRIIHLGFEQFKQGPVLAHFKTRNIWKSFDGTGFLEQTTGLKVYNLPPSERIIDLELTIRGISDEISIGDTHPKWGDRKYHGLCLRGSPHLSSKLGGKIENSQGQVNDSETCSTRAKWCDCSGPLGTEWNGLAIFDNPTNERFPTYWFTVDKMPFISASFTHESSYTVTPRKPLGLVYRIFVHQGDAESGKVNEKFNEYVHRPLVIVGKPVEI